ncbi:MAG: C40 family peptidase, partial [Oscillospiraceae bacterium]|nr:C40 family peptidase [Oscillospiraceae bacterium]
EIGHSPTELVSYLSVLEEGGIFTYDSALQATLDDLFSEQYEFSVETFTEERTTTRTVHAGESLGTVVTSAYCACEICCGRWAGGPTASGVYPQANHTLAVDAYYPTVPLGTEVIINGTLYKVEDTGNFARFGVDFDVFMGSHQEALNWGHRTFEAYLAGGDGEAIEVTTTEEVTVCSVTLRQKSFAQIIADHLTDEQYEQYQIYTESRGNRPFLATPVPYDWTASVAGLYGERCSGTEISMHSGLDLAMPAGTEIYAAFDGTVSEVSGSSVTIQNDRGYEVRYDHCGAVSVSPGQSVNRGDTIGQVGSSVLHLELRHDGTDYNPYFYFETGTGYAIGGGAPELGGGSPAMGDAAFQSMLRIAERQLGTPYVWGGSSPGGFDCSGFVSYVLTQSGVRNVGRTTAQGLYNLCSHVSMSEARPGDLIFFTGTYSSSNPVTHVGIYVGNSQMIHAGDPVKYSSINTPYWQSHYYGMGRP